MKLTLNFLLLLIITAISNIHECTCQATQFSITSNSFIHAKPKITKIQDAELKGSYLDPKSTFTHEIFLNSSIYIKDKFSVFLGMGSGYFNTAYRVKTTKEFLDNELSELDDFRFSHSLSRFYAFRLGASKIVKLSDLYNLSISIGGRAYFADPGESEFGLNGNTKASGEEVFTVVTTGLTNLNKELDFNVDFRISFQSQISKSPIHWKIGLSAGKGLTELWNGTAKLTGDTSTYEFELSNRLSYVGLELGIIYIKNKD